MTSRSTGSADRDPVHRHRAVVPVNHLERVVECVCHAVDYGPVHLDHDTWHSRRGSGGVVRLGLGLDRRLPPQVPDDDAVDVQDVLREVDVHHLVVRIVAVP